MNKIVKQSPSLFFPLLPAFRPKPSSLGPGSFCILRMERKGRTFLSRCLERDVCEALGDLCVPPEKPARVRARRQEGGSACVARAEALGHNRAKTELHRPARRWLLATLITAETPAWDRVMYSSRWRGAHCLCSGGLLEGGKKKGPL